MADGIVRIKVDFDGSAAQSGVKKVEDRLEQLKSKADKVSQSLTSVGTALTVAVTAPIVATGTAAVKAATEIDSSLTSVRKTVDGTAEEYQALKDAAIEFSKTNAVSAADILAIQSLGAQLGFSIDELKEFAEVASGLDIATNMDAETASTQMAQFANITGMSHDEVRQYASTIVELGNNMATTEADISNMAMRLAAAGTQVGMTQADILGMAAALTSMGISAEAGGTAISTIMSSIDKSIALPATEMKNVKGEMVEVTTKAGEMTEAWAEAWKKAAGNEGKSTADFRKAWETDVVGTLSDVLAGMESATDEGGNLSVMLEELGISSIRQTDAMKRLASNSGFLSDAIAIANRGWEENIALDKEVANRNDSIAAKFTMVRNKATAVLNTIGEPLADALLDIIDAAQPLIDSLQKAAEWFANLDESSQRTIISLAAAAAATGPLLAGIGKLIPVGSSMISMFTKSTSVMDGAGKVIGTKLTPNIKTLVGAGVLGAVITVLSIVIPLIVEWKQHSDDVAKATEGLSTAVSRAEGAARDATGPVEAYDRSIKDLRESTDECTKANGELADSIYNGWKDVKTNEYLLDGYLETIKELGNKSGLTKEEQIKLKDAVDKYNEITGESLQVLDPQNGLLSEQTEILTDNAEAWKQKARAEAAATYYSDVVGRQMDTQRQIEEVTAALEDEIATWGDGTMTLDEFLDSTLSVHSDLAKQYRELTGEYEALTEQADYWLGKMVDIDKETQDLTGSTEAETESMQNALRTHENYGTILRDLGVDIDTFAGWLEELGLTTQGLSALTDEELANIAQTYKDTAGDITDELSSLASEANERGRQMMRGYAAGITAASSEAYNAAWNATKSTLRAIQAAQNSASPSKEAMKLGVDLGEGYAEGIDDTAALSSKTASGIAEGALSAMQIGSALSGIDWYSTAGAYASPQAFFGGNSSPVSAGVPTVTGALSSGAEQYRQGDDLSFYGDMVFNVRSTEPEAIAREVLNIIKQARYSYGRR